MFRVISPEVVRGLAPCPAELQEWLINASKNYLAIEVGCGVGYHPLKFALHNPDKHILAIERTSDKFLKFQRRYVNNKSPVNLFPVHADAAILLPTVLHGSVVDEYFVFYPNPYPKNKHKNLRFAYSALTDFMIHTLKNGGKITFATNIQSYASELVEVLCQDQRLCLIENINLPPDHVPRTHFEKKYLEQGDTCIQLVFRRVHRNTVSIDKQL